MIVTHHYHPIRYAALMLIVVCTLGLSCVSAFAELKLIKSEQQEGKEGYLRTFDHNGQERTARVIFPTDDPNDKNPVYPVVFWLHGTTENAAGSDFYFNGVYDGEVGQKFVGVIPHGSPSNNESGKFGWNHVPINGVSKLPKGSIYDYDDIGFLYELCQRLYKDPRIQEGKKGFYFAGHSAGGFMALRMAMVCEATQGLSPSGASIHVPSSLTINHQPLVDVFVENPVSHMRKTGYPTGTDYGGLFIRPNGRYTFNLPADHKVRYVHVNGGCDDKALWNGNLPPGEGNLPDECLAMIPSATYTVTHRTDTLHSDDHGLVENDEIQIFATAGGTQPSGLTDATSYFVRYVDEDSFQLKTEKKGTPVAFSTNGTGTLTWTKTDLEDSGMPLLPILRSANKWAAWNGGQAGAWKIEDGFLHNDKGEAFPYRSYFKTISPSTKTDNIWVIRLKGTGHGGPAFSAMKKLRLSLLLGLGWKP